MFLLLTDLEKLSYESEEPVFVKNLENVQGDERDIILFFIGYGPEAGKIGLNFGPINREGGWRRLNVAVSRARYEMQVFSTLRADHIDLNRSNSEGVAGLKAFLTYAEKGKQALPTNLIATGNDSPGLEQVIASEIRKYGYKVNTSIGCSAYSLRRKDLQSRKNSKRPRDRTTWCPEKPWLEHYENLVSGMVGKSKQSHARNTSSHPQSRTRHQS